MIVGNAAGIVSIRRKVLVHMTMTLQLIHFVQATLDTSHVSMLGTGLSEMILELGVRAA